MAIGPFSQISKWVDGGVVGVPFASVTFSDFDDARRWRRMDLIDGTYETRSFDCCGLGLVTDRDGVTTQLLYDAAGRQIGSTRLGITVTNLLDPAGAAIRTVRVGSDGSTNLLSTSGYDTAGVLRASTNALGGVTTFAWSINGNGELVESSVDPANATQVVTHYRDGGVRSVTGTGVQNRSVTRTFGAQYMDVGSTLMVDGSAVTETVMDAEGNPGDYVITLRDALGQVRRVDQGNSVKHGYAYNRLGQMVQEVDADGITRLYRYNAEGDIEYVAVDINPANTTWDADGNPSIDFNQDRLIRQATDTTTHAGQTVRRQRRWEYPTAGSSTSVEVRAAMVTADARNAWTIDRGQTSAHALAMNRVAQTRNATNTAPDGSWTVAVYTSGRLTSRTAYASNGTQLSRETYGYDPHGRVNQVTDVRNGTRTQTYNAADLLVADTTPASGTGQGPRTTTRQYSTAGRLTRVTLPDGANLDLAYAPDGLLTNRSGGRQPTVGYAYDAAGRLTTLRTWKNAGSQTGAKTTQWSYQAGTGFMVQKAIGNETPIQYTFTAAGRPRTERVMGGDYPSTEWKYGFDADPVVRRVADVTEVRYLGGVDLDGYAATPDLGFTYDRTGRRIGAAQITAGTTNTAVTWSRNAYGLITSESWTAGPLAGHVLSHTYDDKLRRTNLTFRVGTTTNGIVGYGFDTSGRISWIGDRGKSGTARPARRAATRREPTSARRRTPRMPKGVCRSSPTPVSTRCRVPRRRVRRYG
jgi:YD repeat-containing protein